MGAPQGQPQGQPQGPPQGPPQPSVGGQMAGPPRFVPPCAVPAGMPVPNSLAEHQLIERTAGFVAANGEQVLGALAVKQGARLPFLHPAHPLHGYFRQLMLHLQRRAAPPPPRLQGGGWPPQ